MAILDFMSEGEPLEIDLRDLFAAINGKMSAGGSLGDLFGNPDAASEILTQEMNDRLTKGRIELLKRHFSKSGIFKVNAERDSRKLAIGFKDEFRNWQSRVLGNANSSIEDIELVENTTIEDLAKAAENEHDRLARSLAEQIPDSIGYQVVGGDAFRWGVISDIVREASEIRD